MGIKKLEEVDASFMRELDEFEQLFSLKIDNVVVDIKSLAEFRKLGLADYVVGFSTPQKHLITIVEQNESGRDPIEWRKVLVHELVHIFYTKKFRNDKPLWFNEGLACYLAGQKKKDVPITLKGLLDKFSECDKDCYAFGYNVFVKLLGEQK